MTCSPGPYAIQFLYDGSAGATGTGNTRIDVFAVTGDLPTETSNGVTSGAQTGDLIGTFTFPGSGAASTVVYVNSLTCTATVSLRFIIANADGNTPADDGTVTYAQDGTEGLQIQYGC